MPQSNEKIQLPWYFPHQPYHLCFLTVPLTLHPQMPPEGIARGFYHSGAATGCSDCLKWGFHPSALTKHSGHFLLLHSMVPTRPPPPRSSHFSNRDVTRLFLGRWSLVAGRWLAALSMLGSSLGCLADTWGQCLGQMGDILLAAQVVLNREPQCLHQTVWPLSTPAFNDSIPCKVLNSPIGEMSLGPSWVDGASRLGAGGLYS